MTRRTRLRHANAAVVWPRAGRRPTLRPAVVVRAGVLGLLAAVVVSGCTLDRPPADQATGLRSLGGPLALDTWPLPDAGADDTGGRRLPPTLAVFPAAPVDVGAVPIPAAVTRLVRLRNTGAVPFQITRLKLKGQTEAFTLLFGDPASTGGSTIATRPSPYAPLELLPATERAVVLRFAPPDYGPNTGAAQGHWSARLEVVYGAANGAEERALVHLLEGEALDPLQPVARVEVVEGTQVLTPTVLHLSGAKSLAAKGQIESYAWTVTDPAGVTTDFPPELAVQAPAFEVTEAGVHTFCLRVKDSFGAISPTPDCVAVDADALLQQSDLVVRLLWTVPSPGGQSKIPDLDLHVAHPLASGPDIDCDSQPDPWFSNPFDAFWFNPNPNWGSVNPAVDDDPVFAKTATPTTVGEWVVIPEPEGIVGGPKPYNVGVHHWHDHGHGATQVTLTVFVKGKPVFEAKDVTLKPAQMWHVGKVIWPNDVSHPGLDVAPFQPCFQVGDPCDKLDPGKKWQPSGPRCMTECYANPAFVNAPLLPPLCP